MFRHNLLHLNGLQRALQDIFFEWAVQEKKRVQGRVMGFELIVNSEAGTGLNQPSIFATYWFFLIRLLTVKLVLLTRLEPVFSP